VERIIKVKRNKLKKFESEVKRIGKELQKQNIRDSKYTEILNASKTLYVNYLLNDRETNL